MKRIILAVLFSISVVLNFHSGIYAGDAETYLKKGITCANKMDYHKAIKMFGKAISANPKDAEGLYRKWHKRAALG